MQCEAKILKKYIFGLLNVGQFVISKQLRPVHALTSIMWSWTETWCHSVPVSTSNNYFIPPPYIALFLEVSAPFILMHKLVGIDPQTSISSKLHKIQADSLTHQQHNDCMLHPGASVSDCHKLFSVSLFIQSIWCKCEWLCQVSFSVSLLTQ